MLLGDLCLIQSGFSARSRLDPQTDGTLALQQGCVTAAGQLDLSFASFVDPGVGSTQHAVATGDVLLRSRGNVVSAWAVDEKVQGPAIALLPLYILRPDTDILDPGYLAWLLMQGAARTYFARESVGSNIQMIKKPVIAALPIELPALPTQRGIAKIADLATQQQSLETRLTALRLEHTNLQLQHASSAQNNDRTTQ